MLPKHILKTGLTTAVRCGCTGTHLAEFGISVESRQAPGNPLSMSNYPMVLKNI